MFINNTLNILYCHFTPRNDMVLISFILILFRYESNSVMDIQNSISDATTNKGGFFVL